MDITTSPVLHVIDTMGVTTGLYVAILCCDATMLFLGGDIVGKTTDSLGCIMSSYSPWRWAIMHCVGSFFFFFFAFMFIVFNASYQTHIRY